jgi:hypothetical protein
LPAVLCRLYRPSRVSLVLCDGGINAMVEGSKFKESHVLENTKLWNKVGRMPRPLVLFRPSNPGLASFCACFRYPVLGRSCPYASRHTLRPETHPVARQIRGTLSSSDFKSENDLIFLFIFIAVYYITPPNTPNLLVPKILIVSSPRP